MTTHSSILAWRIPQTEDTGGLQSMGLQKSWTQLSNLTTMYNLREDWTLRCKGGLGFIIKELETSVIYQLPIIYKYFRGKLS